MPAPDELIRWIDEVLKGQLEPVPPVELTTVPHPGGARVVVVNVPPSPVLIARKSGQGYEFPIRAGDSKRYMTLLEVEARMQNLERLARLRLEQIRLIDPVVVDAKLQGVDARDWRITEVNDHTFTLSKGALRASVPLGYVEGVYRTNELDGAWVVALDCHVLRIPGPGEHLRIRKFNP